MFELSPTIRGVAETLPRPAAVVNGQPWRLQPWNLEQDDEFPGPWTEEDMGLAGVLPADYAGLFEFGHPTELVTVNRAYLIDFETGTALCADIAADGTLSAWRSVPLALSSPITTTNWSRCAPDALLTRGTVHFVSYWREAWTAKINLQSGALGELERVEDYVGDMLFINNQGNKNNEGSIITRDRIWHLGTETWWGVGWRMLDGQGRIVSGWNMVEGTGCPASEYSNAVTFVVVGRENGQRRIYRIVDFEQAAWAELDPQEPDDDGGPGFRLRPSIRAKERRFEGDWAQIDINGAIPDRMGNEEIMRSVAVGKRVYLFHRNNMASAPINDDASLGEFVMREIPYDEYDYYGSLAMAPEHVMITSSRIYLIDVMHGKMWWAPFRGGRNDYLATTTEDFVPDAPPTEEPGYHIEPQITATGETVAAGTVRARYELRPVIRAEGEDVAAGTVRANYELRPQIAACGGTLHYLNPPGTETGTGDGRSPGYYLRPQIRGKVETAEEDLTRGRWEHPPFTVSGKASLRRQMRGNYVMPLFTVRGAAAGAEPVGDGHWTHPLFHVAGTASLRARHVGVGHYVLPVPRRIRGTMLQEDMDWVLRFRRPEVL